jgi:hypothetical protein
MGTIDKRQAPRRRVLKDGKIVLMNNWSVVDCSVRDISETGARIRCDNPSAVPNTFRLLMPFDNTIRDAQVVWRGENLFGVTFTGPIKRAPPRKW